jgi:hypothetical protein
MVRIEIISAQSTGMVHSICTIGLAMRMDKIILDGLPQNNALALPRPDFGSESLMSRVFHRGTRVFAPQRQEPDSRSLGYIQSLRSIDNKDAHAPPFNYVTFKGTRGSVDPG